ncbi:MAG: TraB/GumN family protein [Bacteroidetes bacterium]|nr:MAG: TraB/GumN family protein [Bacteroidota bacterium]
MNRWKNPAGSSPEQFLSFPKKKPNLEASESKAPPVFRQPLSLLLPMYRSVFQCLACILMLFAAHTRIRAQEPGMEITDLQTEAIPVYPASSLLWEVSGNGLQKPSYIFGILFKVPASYFFLPEGITPLIEASDRIAMEVNPADENLDYLYRGSLPLDSTLEFLLSKKEFDQISTFFYDTLSTVARYKLESRYDPLLLSRQMLCDYCLGFKEGQEPVSYEFYLYNAVRKPLKTLSNGWARQSLMDQYSLEEKTSILMDNYRNKNALCQTYRGLLRAYREQDLDRLWLIAQRAPDFGDNMGQFIEARNREWIKVLNWQMQYESMFIAVHAVQLPGEYGLLHLLRKAGYTVKPIGKPIPATPFYPPK